MMTTSLRILRHLFAPLVLLALAALIIARNSRADALVAPSGPVGTTPAATAAVVAPTGAAAWDALLDDKDGKQVRFGAALDLAHPYSRHAGEAFIPASVTKLFTTGAALQELGPDYRFATAIRWSSSEDLKLAAELAVVGSGDPSWGVAGLDSSLREHLDQIAGVLAKAGVQRIRGPVRLLANDTRWDHAAETPRGWSETELVTCDGARPQAFNLALNCATLVVRDLDHAAWREPGVPTPVRLSLAPGARTAIFAERDVTVPGGGYLLRGTFAKGANPVHLALPVSDVAAWAHALLLQALKNQGIAVDETPAVPAPSASDGAFDRSVTLLSPPLREILKPFLKDSLNVIGEGLFVALGGLRTMETYVATQLASADARLTTLWDGSGMSQDNRVTPAGVQSLLVALAKRADFAAVWNALPIAGVDGTLAYRMRGTAAEGVVRAKTGTLRGAYNLAGYVPRYDAAGKPREFVPFVILAEATPGLQNAAHAAQDRVAARLVLAINAEE